MEYMAKFDEIDGVLFRFDTRIYLGSYNPSSESTCVGAIVGKNPGSAMPGNLGELASLELHGDKMLPTVGNRFRAAYALANKAAPHNAFVRVWNLFYVCGKDLHQAASVASQLPNPLNCESEECAVPFVWLGWGDDDSTLNSFKRRFIRRGHSAAFFYDHRAGKVVSHMPAESDFAKHTQGMPAAPMEDHLSRLV